MKQQGRGQIVIVASDVSKRVFEGGSAYCATKFAQDAFSMALRKEVRRFGIKVSTIFPGLVDQTAKGRKPLALDMGLARRGFQSPSKLFYQFTNTNLPFTSFSLHVLPSGWCYHYLMSFFYLIMQNGHVS